MTAGGAEEVVEHLFSLVERLRSQLDAAVVPFELSTPQAKALRYLAQAGPVPMRELADRLHCDASNVTGIVDRLEQRGLVERVPTRTDRRIKTLVITADGRDLATRVWAGVLDGATGVIGLREDELAGFLALLRRLDGTTDGCCWATSPRPAPGTPPIARR